MSKILIIGVGSAGTNAVKKMKEQGIRDASFITIGGDNEKSDIPHYNLIEMNGCRPFLAAPAKAWEELAENVKDEIGNIIDFELSKDDN